MPAVMLRAYQNRNKPPEFVGYLYLSKYLNIPTEKIKASGIMDNVPFRYDKSGKKLFKYTAAMDAIASFRVVPPDSLHPLHEFTQAETMLEMGFTPNQYRRMYKAGKIRTHISEKTGHIAIYRRDIDRFYREWSPERIIESVTMPVRRITAAMLLGITIDTLKQATRQGRISLEPRHRGQPYMYSKTEMLKFIRAYGKRVFRKRPLPEYLQPSVAALYMGISTDTLRNLRMVGIVKYSEYSPFKGSCNMCYRRSDLDDALDWLGERTYYCKGQTYYTRRAIRYKFLKCERWVEQFVVGKCRRVLAGNEIAPPTGKITKSQLGWLQEDVDKVVASGVELKLRKPVHLRRSVRKAASIQQKATPPVVFSTPVEQMEAAISAALSAKNADRERKRKETLRKIQEESDRLNAIRNILTGGPDERRTSPTRRDRLRFAEERPIVTFLFSSEGMRGEYDNYPNVKDEIIFRVGCGRKMGRRVIPPSFARAIHNALKMYNKCDSRLKPAWVIIVSATSLITDPMFHQCLSEVPPEIGAVAPFGYEYVMPDGSWDRCPASHGSYGMYSAVTGARRKVDGIASTSGSHRVAVMDGPFVALRGEYLRELSYIDFFQQLGDQRGLLGPVISGICRKFSIPMMQISVESWSSAEYFVRPNTPEMNLGIERIATFIERPIERLRG